MNLTAVTEREAVMDRHIGDSLALLPVIERALSESFLNQRRSMVVKPLFVNTTTEHAHLPDVDHMEPSRSESTQKLEASLADEEKQLSVRKEQQVKADSREGAKGAPAGAAGGENRLRVVDVGTGAGLPGLVFAIVRPEWDLVLVESLRKRCTFLEHVVKEVSCARLRLTTNRKRGLSRDYCARNCCSCFYSLRRTTTMLLVICLLETVSERFLGYQLRLML